MDAPIDRIAGDLRRIAGDSHVLTDPALVQGFEIDWTGRWRGRALAVVRPGSAGEVAAVLDACGRRGVGVVPQGGNTGLVGGAVPDATVVLSTVRLADLGPVDEASGEVTVGAGATLEAVASHVAPAGLAPAVDLAARGSATIGGMVATDAGGIHVLRHGSMRRQVVGIEAVLADGSIVRRLPGHRKDAVGLHLPSLLAGSEGTLAVITAVRLRLVPAWPARATALLAVDDVAAAIAVVTRLRGLLPDLDAAEFLDAGSLRVATETGRGTLPFRAGIGGCLLVETASRRATLDELADAIGGLPGVVDAVVADDGPGRRRLWALREGLTEAISTLGVPHKLDVGVPLAAMPAFLAALPGVVAAAAPGARTVVFGHIADGNLHVNVLGPAADDDRVDDAVLRLVLERGGTVSAEHGIGRAKARWLAAARSPEELRVMAAVKRALDPAGILNPGVLDPGVLPTARAASLGANDQPT